MQFYTYPRVRHFPCDINEGWSYLATIILKLFRKIYYNLWSLLISWHLGTLGKRPQLCGIRLLLENRASLRGKSHRNSKNLSRAKTLTYFGKGLCKVWHFERRHQILSCLILQAGTLVLLRRGTKSKDFRKSPFSPICSVNPLQKGNSWLSEQRLFMRLKLRT